MKIVNSIQELKRYLAEERQHNKQIGFVPTMGALHNGHLSLVKRCVEENDVCVVSIFVNPTQFNDKNDLATYPRTLDKDSALLEPVGCDYVFAPTETEMYPEPDTRTFDFGTVSAVMEGARRPGHFNGVAQIVSKLFYAVEPDNAYFGEKDFQQIAVIRAMVKQLNIPVKINACPILREDDGLALSSRNVRLTPEQRQKAPLIARTLKESTNFAAGKSVQETIDYVVNTINADPVMRVEYYEIVDGITMESIKDWSDTEYAVGCITVYCGEVRLIDNVRYK
ncbi:MULTISPECIES: pantoate--beta-alanine ligase [Parabacteroides]|uniref:Pantothenate synthetase n=1 Tax=Parabacteroides gordonii MS-1 = DSM 23371 TaxID=1203610 RepID=A0A0F5JNJ1_9BACT|nr:MULTISPECIES: pantoate--beta-alanine ligase [Parabacteroides]KKB46121.1 pantothenate synthetase [Parabacteroides sp. HGS0025]KKB59274.1 pantothenate synthetase [Parabacteroides gordonii MS-1 = DSM 23371]MCA5583769.1 pantoate--beta-alanine ligase [Parabacteroides gordonii]MCD8136568.1 pantoate--beta-alanine ligase [Parabacteroides gordonii]RGP15047.1 pantoate--beta-alanine ligase [Parabacteroides gordonii]